MKKHLLRFGNKKIPKDTAIFNRCSATDCPAAKLGLCQVWINGGYCYALKAEKAYPTVLPFRRRQEAFWNEHTAAEIASYMISIFDRKRIRVRKLRLNEAGDMQTQSDIAKAAEIARILKKRRGIKTYTYTARKDLDWSERGLLVVNGSGFVVDNGFFYLPKGEALSEGFEMCAMNCKRCVKCAQAKGRKISVPQH